MFVLMYNYEYLPGVYTNRARACQGIAKFVDSGLGKLPDYMVWEAITHCSKGE